MQRTIFITGSTDGIGLETAKRLTAEDHHVILHGRNPSKLSAAEMEVRSVGGEGNVTSFLADLSVPDDVVALADAVLASVDSLDVLINNAGIFATPNAVTAEGLDVRFVVNTLAPYVLTKRLLPLLGRTGRVVNLSSAAQAPIDARAVRGSVQLSPGEAYAQSKLGITMWSRHLADQLGEDGPSVVSVNPGSLLATKMVREGYGIAGSDIGQGADILVRAALSAEFDGASGKYFDNDSGSFASPHPDALDLQKNAALVALMEEVINATA